MQRDPRIDFLRGVVLLLIVADHVLNNSWSLTPILDWYFFDLAPAFIFLSGFVSGRVYSNVLATRGFLAAHRKALRRAVQLYLANLIVLAAALLVVMLFRTFHAVDAREFGLQTLLENPRGAMLHALTLTYTPWLMGILQMYVLLLLVTPAMLSIYRRSRFAAIAVSLLLYCVAQLYPELTPREYPSGLPWFWNPLGWQIVFFTAAWLGVEHRRGRLHIPRSLTPVLAAIGCVLCIAALYHFHRIPYRLMERQRLAPVNVVSFLLLTYLFAAWLRPHWRVWNTSMAQAVIRCGRHSLEIFCCGVVFDYIISLVLLLPHHLWLEPALILCGVIASIAAAEVIERIKSGQNRTEPVMAASPV